MPDASTHLGQTDGVMTHRSRFAGGDQAYLRDEQYADSSRLAARERLHAEYGTASVPWFTWIAEHVNLIAACDVLEVGCGAGWLWGQAPGVVPPGVSLVLSDLSPGMVGAAVARADGRGCFAEVTGRTADCQALPFESQRFDRVVANHMLYHLPDPVAGVAELARVTRPDGVVVVATNGSGHMRELWELRGRVFGIDTIDSTLDVFGAEVGFGPLRDRFDQVTWHRYHDELRCTDAAAVVDYVCSTPPGEDADADQRAELESAVDERFDAGDGVMTITKDVGCFVCTAPRPA